MATPLGPVGQKIVEKLTAALSPTALEVIDDSKSHAGHAGNPGGDRESHFHVRVTSAAFNGQSRVTCQRLVNAALKEEVRSGQIHALSMELTPTEA